MSQAAYIHLAASIPNMHRATDTESTYLSGDISADRPSLENGLFAVPDRPGVGIEPDLELIERCAMQHIEGAYLDPHNPGKLLLKPAYW